MLLSAKACTIRCLSRTEIPLPLVKADDDSEPDEEEICMEIPYGQVSAKIVNTQYFTGILTERETVRLVRDTDIYEQTATIRADNIMGNEVCSRSFHEAIGFTKRILVNVDWLH